ncbi:hypothetical protein ACQ4WX_05525 [Streptomyces lasalocidi]
MTGPGVGGGLVQLAGAHLAVIADAIGYLLSALFLLRVEQPEETPASAGMAGRCAGRSAKVSGSS